MKDNHDAWVETPRGYGTYCRAVRGMLVVFWFPRGKGWKFVCDDTFDRTVYSSVFGAMTAAEARWLEGESREKEGVVDIRPHWRKNRQSGRTEDPSWRPYQEPRKQRRQYDAQAQQRHRERMASLSAQLRRRRPEWVDILELAGNGPWTLADVKAQYRKLAMKYHPDRGGDAAKMARINTAYDNLLKAAQAQS